MQILHLYNIVLSMWDLQIAYKCWQVANCQSSYFQNYNRRASLLSVDEMCLVQLYVGVDVPHDIWYLHISCIYGTFKLFMSHNVSSMWQIHSVMMYLYVVNTFCVFSMRYLNIIHDDELLLFTFPVWVKSM